MDEKTLEKAIMQGIKDSVEKERLECELVALRFMEQNQGTDVGRVAGEIAATIRSRS